MENKGDMDSSALQVIDGFAGIAALVNSLIMWPIIRRVQRLEPRMEALEEKDRERDKKVLVFRERMKKPRGAGGII